MAFEVTERWSTPTSAGSSDDEGRNLQADATRSFQIVAPNAGYSPVLVRHTLMATGKLPQIGSTHPEHSYLICREVEVGQSGPIYFEASARYRQIGSANGEDPTGQPPDIQYSHIVTEEAIDEDADGKPICTVLGESFDPPLTRPFADLFIRVTKSVLDFNPLLASAYMHKVNSDEFLGLPPGTLLVEEFSASSVITQTESGIVAYWRQTIGIHVRRGAPRTSDARAWWKRVRAEGFYIKVDIPVFGLVKALARDEAGEPVSKPVLHKVDDGTEITDPQDAEWYEFKVFESIPFQPLSFI